MLDCCPVVVLLKATFTPMHCLSSEKLKDRLAAVSQTQIRVLLSRES